VTDVTAEPTAQEVIQVLRDEFPDAVVLVIEDAAFFSMDDSHWPNFATVVWSDRHDVDAPARLDREGVFRLNFPLAPQEFKRLVGDMADADDIDYSMSDTLLPHPTYGKQRWVGIVNPSHTTLTEVALPFIRAAHDRLARP
jgi:hypothetical protein